MADNISEIEAELRNHELARKTDCSARKSVKASLQFGGLAGTQERICGKKGAPEKSTARGEGRTGSVFSTLNPQSSATG